MKTFGSIQTADWTLQKIQDNVASSLNPIAALPLLDGVLIESISLVSGQDNQIAHQLKRIPRLWFLVKQNTNTTVWEVTSPASSKYLSLRCGSNCTVSLWVA